MQFLVITLAVALAWFYISQVMSSVSGRKTEQENNKKSDLDFHLMEFISKCIFIPARANKHCPFITSYVARHVRDCHSEKLRLHHICRLY